MTNEEPSRYTLGQFMSLNLGLIKIDPNLSKIWDTYTMPECSRELPYNNKSNIRFNDKEVTSKPVLPFKRQDAYSDNNILSDLRNAFSSVVKGDGGTVHAIAKLNQTLIPVTMIDEVSNLFYTTIIHCPNQIEEYLNVLFGFTQPNSLEKKVHFEFVKIAMNNFRNPIILKDSLLEDGESRTKKHRLASCQLIAYLFMYNYDPIKNAKPRELFTDVKKLREKFIEPLLQQVKTDSNTIKIIAIVWEILKPKYNQVLLSYKSDLQEIYNDKQHKLTLRIVLKDYCQ